MSRERFELALERMQPTDWRRFEILASKFLVPEFPELRTTASPGGDRGRDGELFSADGIQRIVFQYSVTEYWDAKIKRLLPQIAENFPDAQILVYVTNQVIGAEADPLKAKALADYNLTLDVRDRSWFLDRQSSNDQREIAAEKLAEEFVDPLLNDRGVSTTKTQILTEPEQRSALLYLGLQWEDDNRDRGLTKLTTDALIRSVLRSTTADNRMPAADVYENMRTLLPTHSKEEVDSRTEAALRRLSKKSIRHHTKTDEYCLAHKEVERVNEKLIQLELDEKNFEATTRKIVSKHVADNPSGESLLMAVDFGDINSRVRRVIDLFLFNAGEAFATAVKTGSYRQLEFEDLQSFVEQDFTTRPAAGKVDIKLLTSLIAAAAQEVITTPDEAISKHLRYLADSYTLLAFLRETQDVQDAVVKMFSHGEIWLDTSIVLPLLSEYGEDDRDQKFTRMVRSARDAGLKLWVTNGIIDEIESHLNKSRACANRKNGDWVGEVPFLYSRYIANGGSSQNFRQWLENFVGDNRPRDDLKDFLLDEFGILVKDLNGEVEQAPKELRQAVTAIWFERRKSRDEQFTQPVSQSKRQLLVKNDVENYVGVIERRRHEALSAFGYSAWLLTLDRTAFRIRTELKEWIDGPIPDTPVLSADFLINYLVFGPNRKLISKAQESELPISLGIEEAIHVPPELIALASKIREELEGLPERVKRRKIRDQLDRAKRKLGHVSISGFESLEDELASETNEEN